MHCTRRYVEHILSQQVVGADGAAEKIPIVLCHGYGLGLGAWTYNYEYLSKGFKMSALLAWRHERKNIYAVPGYAPLLLRYARFGALV